MSTFISNTFQAQTPAADVTQATVANVDHKHLAHDADTAYDHDDDLDRQLDELEKNLKEELRSVSERYNEH